MPADHLDESDLHPDPFVQFARWLGDATLAGVDEPTAMVLSTVGADGRPSSRAVLLKGTDHGGFVFFTNHDSRKARELAANPQAALVFLWPALHRQVRVTGRVGAVSAEESDAYFASRPRGSRIGAWASPQSRAIESRETLEHLVAACEARFADRDDIPRPPHWGGFRLLPDAIEFWQGRPSRLHDRLRYEAVDDGWRVVRLAP